ncbi:FtsB family cell division protein [Leucobacter luti]|uniref:FtsB family cell division protein n=1 Tax=Leucobacter luti TaxID=340320 RepID=UPI003D045068
MKRWTEDLGAWASSLRFSGFTALVVVLVIAGALIVSPSLSTFVQQRREIAELRESVKLHKEAVTEIDAERAKWKDPVYVRSQARDRLFYVMPGETQLNVVDDVVLPVESDEKTSAKLTRVESDWARGIVSSFLSAGTAAPPVDPSTQDPAAPDPAAQNPDPETTTPEVPEGEPTQ